ncbi:probable polyamine transporter At1g31830 [Cryptomeria japonica]|uniref:probable polyamine transporter At1g31830 n=1 Tax=Cryptomeria japonica TaxID=3369 RepID=UPI0025ACA009|nr:probable polyamine transporter At1g31830 [Cryptomeria japonica]XP_057850765.1 probable polyamine transporter At1g31830 [Cryptomeria japonica]
MVASQFLSDLRLASTEVKQVDSVNELHRRGKCPVSRGLKMNQDFDSTNIDAPKSPKSQIPSHKLSIVPLVFLIFYEVSGGPFGVEDSVKAGGPLLAILGFLIFPLLWSIPEALVTAELGTMFPENGGYVVWISAAFGPFWGFQQGWWKWLSGVIDNALYPVLFLDYLKSVFPVVGSGIPRIAAIIVITLALTYLNYRGLTIVGWASVCLGIFSLLPFCMMGIISIPHLEPSKWLKIDTKNIDWNVYLNTLFWNLNYWDSVSTLAGEVENPKRTLPKALYWAVLLVVGTYILPLLSAIGSIDLVRSQWNAGYFADVAKILGGFWLQWWVEAASALSNMGMFEAEMSSDSFQLLGMAERGMLPSMFAVRSKYGTPLLGILFSASGVLLLSSMTFQEIVAAENYLYCFGMFAEFAAFMWLRFKEPNMYRPYKVPFGVLGVILLCLPPSLLLILVVVIASRKVMVVSLTAVLIGFLLYPCLGFVRKEKWAKFATNSELPDLQIHEDLVPDDSSDSRDMDAEVGLLSAENKSVTIPS